MAPQALVVEELRALLLSRWPSLAEAFKAAGLERAAHLTLEDLQRLFASASTSGPGGEAGAEAGGGPDFSRQRLEAGVAKLFAELSVGVAGTATTAGQGASAPTVPRYAAALALGAAAPWESLRGWALRMLVLGGLEVLDELALLAGSEERPACGGRLTRLEFQEAAAMLNANSNSAGCWYDELFGLLTAAAEPPVTQREGPQRLRRTTDVTPVSTSSSSRSWKAVGSAADAMDGWALVRKALADLQAEDGEEQLRLEEVAVRLIAVWGDLSCAFGLSAGREECTPRMSSSGSGTTLTAGSPGRVPSSPVATVPRSHAAQAVIDQCSSTPSSRPDPRRRGWRPAKRQWCRALTGKLGRCLFAEKECRLEAERLAGLPDIAGPLFPNLCDRLLVAKLQWQAHELITVRYMLRGSGFWGPCGPLPLAPCARKLPLGARPFIAVAYWPGMGEGEEEDDVQDSWQKLQVEHRAPVDPQAGCAAVMFRAPEQRAATWEAGSLVSHWELRLFGSDDGVTPTVALSQPLRIQVVLAVPRPPSRIVVLRCSHDSVLLSWAPAAAEGRGGAALYEVGVWECDSYPEHGRLVGEPAIWMQRTSELSACAFPLRSARQHVARVRSANCAGMGSWSQASGVFTTGPALPRELAAPAALSAGQFAVQLRWASSGDATVVSHSVCVIPVPSPACAHGSSAGVLQAGVVRNFGGAATEALVDGLMVNKRYRFKVRAHNCSGAGPWSGESELVSTMPGPPEAMSPPVLVEAAEDAVQLTWEYPLNDGGAKVIGYRLQMERAAPASGSLAVNVLGPPLWVHGLEGNSLYNASIAAVNGIGCGDFSSPRVVRTGPVPPEPPHGLAVVDASAEGATVSWQPPASDGGASIIQYRVRAVPLARQAEAAQPAAEAAVGPPQGGGDASAVLPPMPGATEYAVTVRAQNRVGLSAWSAPVVLRTGPTVPFAPATPPRLVGEAGLASLQLRWKAPPCDGGSPVLRYEVWLVDSERCPGSGDTASGEQPRYLRAEACYAVVGQLLPGHAYCVAVRAENVRGWGPVSRWSAPIRTAPPPPAAPSQPRGVDATAHSVLLQWEPPESEAPVLEYEAWWSCAAAVDMQEAAGPPGGGRRGRTKLTTLRLPGLAAGARYVFRVRARNCSGWSQWSPASEPCSTSEVLTLEEIKATVLRKLGGTVTSAFRSFDRNGDGAISREEFIAAFDEARLASAVPREQRARLFAHADEEGLGVLRYREFAQAFSPYRATPALMRQLMPEMSGGDRQELLEQIHHGRRSSSVHQHPKVARAVQHLTSPRRRLSRASSEQVLQQRKLGNLDEEHASPISGLFPYRVRRRSQSADERSESQWSEQSLGAADLARARSPRSAEAATPPRGSAEGAAPVTPSPSAAQRRAASPPSSLHMPTPPGGGFGGSPLQSSRSTRYSTSRTDCSPRQQGSATLGCSASAPPCRRGATAAPRALATSPRARVGGGVAFLTPGKEKALEHDHASTRVLLEAMRHARRH